MGDHCNTVVSGAAAPVGLTRDAIKQIYYQRQNGGNCRLHALNGYYGREEITVGMWDDLMNQYDDVVAKLYNTRTSCKQFDLIGAGGQTMMGWVLMRRGVCVRYVPMGSASTALALAKQVDWMFVFNHGHVWGIRKLTAVAAASQPHVERWFRVDSIGGVSSFDINALQVMKEGLLVPVDPQNEFNKCITQAVLLVGDGSAQRVMEWVTESIKRGDTLGNLEANMSRAVTCLEAQLSRCGPGEMDDVVGIIFGVVSDWHAFMTKWTNGRYNDVGLISAHLPRLLVRILAFQVGD